MFQFWKQCKCFPSNEHRSIICNASRAAIHISISVRFSSNNGGFHIRVSNFSSSGSHYGCKVKNVNDYDRFYEISSTSNISRACSYVSVCNLRRAQGVGAVYISFSHKGYYAT